MAKKTTLSAAQRAALAKGRAKLAKRGKKKASKEGPRTALKDVRYRGYTIFPIVGTTSPGRRFYEADITKGNTSVDFVTGSTRAIVLRRARRTIDKYFIKGVPHRKVKRGKKKVVKVSYATRARLLKARGGKKNRRARTAHLGAAVATAVANPSTPRRAKKKGKKNRSARLGAAAKPSRARRQRPGEGFAYLVQVQDSNSKKRTRKNPEVDTGTASPARAKQIAAAFLRSV